MTNKVFLLEMKVLEKDELEKTNEEKMKTLTEEKAKEKEEIIEKGEKEKKELKEKMVSLKEAIMGQIRGIQKSGNGRIHVDMCDCLEKTFPAPKQEQKVVRSGQGQNGPSWECSTCTYINPEESQSCGMCSKSREDSSREAGSTRRFPASGYNAHPRNNYNAQPPSNKFNVQPPNNYNVQPPQNNVAVWEGNGRVLTGYLEQEEDDETIEIID